MAVVVAADGAKVGVAGLADQLLGPATTDTSGLSMPMPLAGVWADGFVAGMPLSFSEMFAQQALVGTAVMRLITWSVRVPWKAYERGPKGEKSRVEPTGIGLGRALVEPWPGGFQAQLVSHMLGSLLVHGNALTLVENTWRGIRFTPLDWRTVTPLRKDPRDPWSPIVAWRKYVADDDFLTLSATQVLHQRWWSPLGVCGVSPLMQLGTTIRSEDTASRMAATGLENAARPSGVVLMDEKFLGLEPAERQRLYEQTVTTLRGAYSGQPNQGKLAVLPPGLTWTSISYATAVEAQLIEQRKLNREEVAAVFQIPPALIGVMDGATMNNMREFRDMGIVDGLMPQLVLIEQSTNAFLHDAGLVRGDVFSEFDFAGILRGDRLKEVQAFKEAISSGQMTPNEARNRSNLPAATASGADDLYLPMNNLQPLGSTGQPTEG